VFLAEFFSWAFWLIPRPIRYWLADRIADIFRRSTHTYRDNVEANVSQVLGVDQSNPQVADATRSIFRTSARNFVDLITMPRESRETLLDSLKITSGDWSPIDEALAQGKGVILAACHLGSFDQAGQVLWARGYKLTIVTGRTTSRFIFDGVTHLRGSKGATLVEPTPSGVRKVIKALRNGECAVIVSDRDFFQNGRTVEFFGKTTSLPPGAIRIARDTGAVVVPIMTRRLRHGHEMAIAQPFTVEKTADLEADMTAGFDKLIHAMEAGIRERVAQWVMFQRVWPVAPVPAVRVFPVGSPLESELLEKVAQALPERTAGERSTLIDRIRGEDRDHRGSD
jgi:KDO2-lipid IV(A) lauroyltransferase